ncbi:MAG: hypothetical protein ACRDL5_18725 [Solirubrobacteraceae bacterium]
MRFSDFLRATVMLSAAAASALAAVTLGTAVSQSSDAALEVALGWWAVAVLAGLLLGRRADASPPIATLLARARFQGSLPEVNPARTMLNRLWPLLLCMVGAGALGALLAQVPAIAAGFGVIWALAWRHQASAVTAIEHRDGVRFYVAHTSPLRAIELIRTPGLRAERAEHNGAGGTRRSRSRS